MQVNKYIPHYQRIPSKVEKKDIKLFQEDYNTDNLASDADKQRLQKIQHQIISFDRIILNTLLVDRERKFKDNYSVAFPSTLGRSKDGDSSQSPGKKNIMQLPKRMPGEGEPQIEFKSSN
jgi:hypothetical protein